MKKIWGFLFIALLGPMAMVSVAQANQNYSWDNIKTVVNPTIPKPATMGYLRVYTKDETVNDGGYLWQRGPRYLIYTANGKKIRWSENDGGPNTFTLAPGKYVIVPYDREYKNEITGAILEQGKITEVHLMGG